MAWFERLAPVGGTRRRGSLIGYLIAVGLVGCAAVLRGVLGFAPGAFPYLTFFPAIFLSAMIGGLGPGLFAAVLSGIAAWFFLPLDRAFALPAGADALPLIFYALVSFFICLIIGGFQGTGLGLSQVYGFLKQSGGHVTIYSEPGKGTTVKLYLPRSLTAEESLRVATVPIGDLSARGETVLLVEDDTEVRSHTAGLLRELGYGVVEAGNVTSALATLRETPEVKLLFTDVGLPDGDGHKLANAARAIRPELKILFMTGYTRNAIIHHGLLDPGVLALTKPFNFENLAARVKTALVS